MLTWKETIWKECVDFLSFQSVHFLVIDDILFAAPCFIGTELPIYGRLSKRLKQASEGILHRVPTCCYGWETLRKAELSMTLACFAVGGSWKSPARAWHMVLLSRRWPAMF